MSLLKKAKSDSPHSGEGSEISKGYETVLPLQERDFTSKSCWTDLKLEVEDKALYVPRSLLALVSPVFRRMFESDFKEKDLDALPLPGKKYEDVLIFLKCTHPGEPLKVTYDVVPNVLPLAHEYQVQWLLDDCTQVMKTEFDAARFSKAFENTWSYKSTNANVRKYCDIVILAEQYGFISVIDTFVERFSTISYKLYKDVPEFNKISIEVRYKILCRRLDSKD